MLFSAHAQFVGQDKQNNKRQLKTLRELTKIDNTILQNLKIKFILIHPFLDAMLWECIHFIKLSTKVQSHKMYHN